MMEILRVLAEGTGRSPRRSARQPVARSFRYQLVWKGRASHSSFRVFSSACMVVPPISGRSRRPGGAPARLGLREPGTAIDEGEVARAAPALLVGGRLVDLQRLRVDDHAIVLPRAARRHEAASHVVAHALGIARERVAPAAAPARLEAQDVAARDGDAVAQGRQLALAGRAGIQEHASGPPRAPARHAIRRDERVLHARGQLRALAEHAHVANGAGAPAMMTGAPGVRADAVALDAQREIALDVLDRVVLLGDVVDDVHPVREGARAQTHAEALDAEDGALARLVPGPEVIEHVHGRAGRDAAAIGLGQGPEDAREHAEARVRAHAERGGEARLEETALARDPLVEVLEQPLVDLQLGIDRL